MSLGVYVLGGICPRGYVSGGKCPGGKCPGGTCPGRFCAITVWVHSLDYLRLPHCQMTWKSGTLERLGHFTRVWVKSKGQSTVVSKHQRFA